MSRIIVARLPVEKCTEAGRKSTRKSKSKWRESQPRLCPLCGKRNAVEEHHIAPKGRRGCKEVDSEFNRILICNDCHGMAQQYKIPLRCVILAKLSVIGWDKSGQVRQAVGRVLGRDITEMDGIG